MTIALWSLVAIQTVRCWLIWRAERASERRQRELLEIYQPPPDNRIRIEYRTSMEQEAK